MTLEEMILDAFGSVLELVAEAERVEEERWFKRNESRERLERHQRMVKQMMEESAASELVYGPGSEHSFFRDLLTVQRECSPGVVHESGCAFVVPRWMV